MYYVFFRSQYWINQSPILNWVQIENNMKQVINKTKIKYILHFVNMSENKMNTSRLRALSRKSFIFKILRNLIKNKYLRQQTIFFRKSSKLILFSRFIYEMLTPLVTLTVITHEWNSVSNSWQDYFLIEGSHTALFFWKSGVYQTHLYVFRKAK